MRDYKIVTNENPITVANEVRALAQQGWDPGGELIVTAVRSSVGVIWRFTQTMVLFEARGAKA